MSIYVDGQEIQQIFLGGSGYIAKVYYGKDIVFEASYLFRSNIPAEQKIYLSPGIYELVLVGGAGGSTGGGNGGSGSGSFTTVAATAGE